MRAFQPSRAALGLSLFALGGSVAYGGEITISQQTATHNYNLTEWSADSSHVSGQTFRTPNATQTVLTEFSFDMPRRYGLDYEAFVYELKTYPFSGPALVGPALYSSGARNTGDSGNDAPPVFANLHISLDPSKQYVAFLSTAGLNSGPTVYGVLKGTNTNPYADGWLFQPWSTNSLDSVLATTNSGEYQNVSDLVFSMKFVEPTAVPDSGLGLPLLTGLLVALTAVRKQSTRRTWLSGRGRQV